jgi:hypothetical protein
VPTWGKVALSIIGVFLGGATAAYQLDPCPGSWLKWVMAGIVPVGGYLIGYCQLNPMIRPPISYAGVPPAGR